MGFGLDRVVGKKFSEPHCLVSSGKQRSLSNDSINVSEAQYSLNSTKGKSRDIDSKGVKNVDLSKCERDLKKSDSIQDLGLRENLSYVENEKLDLKGNGVKHLRSESFRDEGRNSVIRKQETESNVKMPRTPGNSSTIGRDDSKNCLNEKASDSHIGNAKSRSGSSFGNIFRGKKNTVVSMDLSHQKLPQVPRVSNNVTNVPLSSSILGLGGGSYGHGSIIRGGKSVEVLISSAIDSKKKERHCETSYSKTAEELNNSGNEEYKLGHFLEAISFYDMAIALCPRNAPCHNNKAAALTGLGRYLEALEECLEAIKCDPSYSRAHHRLGTLYIRLGQVDNAKQHLQLSGLEIGPQTRQNLVCIETHLMNIRNAKKVENWRRILTEGNLAIEAGADSSYEVLVAKAEALLKLNKANESLEVLTIARKSGENKMRSSHDREWGFLIIEIQAFISLGRFDDGILAAEHAVNLDARPESLIWLKKARGVSDARKAGNELYKAEKYLEACMAYTRGLEGFPTNSVLLSNRAACRIKLGLFERAVDDCDVALRSQSSNSKALLRRAQSNAKLERWEESLRDYTVLNQERPEDISIANSLAEVQLMFKKANAAKGLLSSRYTRSEASPIFLCNNS